MDTEPRPRLAAQQLLRASGTFDSETTGSHGARGHWTVLLGYDAVPPGTESLLRLEPGGRAGTELSLWAFRLGAGRASAVSSAAQTLAANRCCRSVRHGRTRSKRLSSRGLLETQNLGVCLSGTAVPERLASSL